MRDEQSQQATQPGKQNAFREQLSDQPQPVRSQRGANGKLPRASHGPREHQTCNIRAGNQQHQPDNHCQNHQRRTELIAKTGPSGCRRLKFQPLRQQMLAFLSTHGCGKFRAILLKGYRQFRPSLPDISSAAYASRAVKYDRSP